MKNKKAQFTKKTKQQAFERDWWRCIICSSEPHSIHHAWFGTESLYWSNRNDLNMGCTLCFNCHNMAHACSKWEWVRKQCIDYLKKYDS